MFYSADDCPGRPCSSECDHWTPAQAVSPQTWQERYTAAGDRLMSLSEDGGMAGARAYAWAHQCYGAAILAERLGL